MTAKKKYQHYIPKFILKLFLVNGSTSFSVFDVKKQAWITSPRGASNSMGAKLFYEHNEFEKNEIEDLLARREKDYATVVKILINGGAFDMEMYLTLIEFRHTMYYRSNEFTGFHNFKANRGTNSWMQRWDWRSLNGLNSSASKSTHDYERAIKRSQLMAIQAVIARTDAAYCLSSMTPICYVFRSKKGYIISDNGSISLGEELKGFALIVISPNHALAFPKLNNAAEILKKSGLSAKVPHIFYEDVEDDFTDLINNKIRESAFEYYVDAHGLS